MRTLLKKAFCNLYFVIISKMRGQTDMDTEEFCKLRSKFKNPLYAMNSNEFNRFWELRCMLVGREQTIKLKNEIDYYIIF